MMRFLLAPLVVVATGVVLACGLPLLFAATLAMADEQTVPSARARAEIPASLLARYQQSPACSGLPWQVVAAIGYVESRHATTGGGYVDPGSGNVSPRIVGIALDGTRSAAIRVPSGGSPWHPDPVWDHATGPMQFITGTWVAWAVDASGDGLASPHNAYDAIASAGRYLCGGKRRLDGPDAIAAAIRRYNPSARYVQAVLAKAYAYGMTDGGDPVGAIPAAGNPAVSGPVIHGNVRPVVAYALAHVGDPYVWGAKGPNAFDCSGLTLAAYRQIGIRLPHRSSLQVRYGEPVAWRREPVEPGDLLFLRGGRPAHDFGHVGVAISRAQWVQAPRTGDVVKLGSLPYDRLQAVRRLVSR
jgi:cell wall-associated NlpC family hydrolase